MNRHLLILLAGILLLSRAPAQSTTRVSVDSAGVEGNLSSSLPSISSNGRYVAFYSNASNLVVGDTNGRPDVFVHDRMTGLTTRVSLNSAGGESNGDSTYASISPDGRYVAFNSSATNLVPGDTNARRDVFVHDRHTGQTTRISLSSAGVQGNQHSFNPAISADGLAVAFASEATNLVPGDTNGAWDVFVHDRQTGLTSRVSVDSAGTEGNGTSASASISADGRFVAFNSSATNLVPGDTNTFEDAFVHDRQTGLTSRVSVDSAGQQANGYSSGGSVSADGRFIGLRSFADNLVPGDTNAQVDAFVHDRLTGQTVRVSVDSAGVQGTDTSAPPSMSKDGRFAAFGSRASNLVPGDTNHRSDIFLHDLQTGQTRRVSVTSGGLQSGGSTYGNVSPAISADGTAIVFISDANNLVPGDTNGVNDIFVHSRGTFSIVKTGFCPGPITLTISHASNHGAIAIVHGLAGSFVKPGMPCQGILLGISSPILATRLSANGSGTAVLNFNAQSNLCGLSVQAIDVWTCDVTNVIVL